ncbi:Uncharacterized protein M6B38_234045 [Iris pallida]|uniref:Uncharacterized protein n=1 Tax=Iris pallida TaxID=29817 RepID=A0AAX6DQ40_IRIPA|nr:Uncharacterized protein M6B38_234045 [Iris pallida]
MLTTCLFLGLLAKSLQAFVSFFLLATLSALGYCFEFAGSVVTSATASGAAAARSMPLRPMRMSPGSHQKYTTLPKKGEGEFPSPMSMELAVETFESLGLYPNIEGIRGRLRQKIRNPYL